MEGGARAVRRRNRPPRGRSKRRGTIEARGQRFHSSAARSLALLFELKTANKLTARQVSLLAEQRCGASRNSTKGQGSLGGTISVRQRPRHSQRRALQRYHAAGARCLTSSSAIAAVTRRWSRDGCAGRSQSALASERFFATRTASPWRGLDEGDRGRPERRRCRLGLDRAKLGNGA